jgi:4-hydroxy-tetrahydrodipicolinate synthase
MSLRFEGTYTAIITPFRDSAVEAQRSIDWEAYEKIVQTQIDGGVAGIVPCGTTGESPALDYEEQRELIERTVKLCAKTSGKTIVLAGTGTNSTRGTIACSQAAEKAGADAVMVVTPYYNKPTQEGLREHFLAVAASVKIPVVVYNIPSRSVIDLTADTLAKIAEAAPNVVATKEATGNVLRCAEIARLLGDRMTVLCGDDTLTLPMISVGAKGVISVTSNLYPAEVVRATRLALDGKMDEARRAHLALCRVHEAMFVEANPSPVKAAVGQKLKISDAVRGPLVRASEAARAKIFAAMAAYESGSR